MLPWLTRELEICAYEQAKIVGSRASTRPLGLPVCLPVTGIGHDLEAWPVTDRPGLQKHGLVDALVNKIDIDCINLQETKYQELHKMG